MFACRTGLDSAAVGAQGYSSREAAGKPKDLEVKLTVMDTEPAMVLIY